MTETDSINRDITEKISEPDVSTKVEWFETRLPKAYIHFSSEAKKIEIEKSQSLFHIWASYLGKVLGLAYARSDEYDGALRNLREESAERKGEKVGRLDLKEALDKYSEGRLCQRYRNILEPKLKRIVEESGTPLLRKAHSSLMEYKSTYPSLSSAFDPILESLVLDDRFIERHERELDSIDRYNEFLSTAERRRIIRALYLTKSLRGVWDSKTCSYPKINHVEIFSQ